MRCTRQTNLRQADIPKDIAQVDPEGYPTAIRRSMLAKALGENAADASDETLAALFEARGSLAGAADYMLRDIASVTENARRIAAYRDVVGRHAAANGNDQPLAVFDEELATRRY